MTFKTYSNVVTQQTRKWCNVISQLISKHDFNGLKLQNSQPFLHESTITTYNDAIFFFL